MAQVTYRGVAYDTEEGCEFETHKLTEGTD